VEDVQDFLMNDFKNLQKKKTLAKEAKKEQKLQKKGKTSTDFKFRLFCN